MQQVLSFQFSTTTCDILSHNRKSIFAGRDVCAFNTSAKKTCMIQINTFSSQTNVEAAAELHAPSQPHHVAANYVQFKRNDIHCTCAYTPHHIINRLHAYKTLNKCHGTNYAHNPKSNVQKPTICSQAESTSCSLNGCSNKILCQKHRQWTFYILHFPQILAIFTHFTRGYGVKIYIVCFCSL